MSSKSISVSFIGNNISINKEGEIIDSLMPNNFSFNNSLSGQELQYLMRKLDCIKDAKEGDGITNRRDIMNSIYPGQNNISDDTLKEIRGKLIDANINYIEPDSWLKSSSCTVSYDYIKNVFYETGLDPEDFIVDFKNPSVKPFKLVGSFPSEIGDPGSRRPEKFGIRFPELGTTLSFDPSFMNYFGFGKDTTYKATLTKVTDKVGTYDYSIDLGSSVNNVMNVFGAEVNPRVESDLVIDRFISTTKLTGTFDTCGKSFPLLNKVSADEYFKGNNYKNSLINVLYAKNAISNLPEIKRYLIAKEMGDVMQVLLMMVWQIVQQLPDKKNYCMTSLDSIVFMLCILLEQPCMYTHNSNKGLEKEDKCYRLQYYYPAVVTEEERLRTRFQQKYIEIFNSNLKIKNFYNRIFIEKVIYIGNTMIEYSNDTRKLNILNTYFFTPILKAFEEISQGLEDFNDGHKNAVVLSENDLEEMYRKYYILPIFGLKEKGKKKNYYINPGISNYTAERVYDFEGILKPSFWEVFQKLYSNTISLPPKVSIGGSTGTYSLPDAADLEDNTSNMPELIEETETPLIETVEKNQPLEEEPVVGDMNEEEPVENSPLDNVLDLSNPSDISDENKEQERTMDQLDQSFSYKLFLTFISQVVKNLSDGNLTDKLIEQNGQYYTDELFDTLELLKGETMKSDEDIKSDYINNSPEETNEIAETLEDLPIDGEAIYYYYYDMLVYLSFIQKYVYYDDELMEQMKKLKQYYDKSLTIKDIISNPLPEISLQNMMAMDDNINLGCPIVFSESQPNNENISMEITETSDNNPMEEEGNLPEVPKEHVFTPEDNIITDNKKRSSSSTIEPVTKRVRNAGGTKKKKAKKVNKTRKANRKRSIKKKTSRRKQKKTRRKSFK